MKFITILLSVLLFLVAAVTADAEGGCDCNDKIADATQALMNEKNGLAEQQNRIREELDACANDKAGLYQEVEQVRKSLAQARSDADYWMKASGEHEGSAKVAEEKIRNLGGMEGKMKSLEAELFAAKEEIKGLSEISFVSQLKKEIDALWQSMVAFWQKLTAKKEESEEL
jgi:chromosome segregation ATPase